MSNDGTDNNDAYWDDLFEWFDGECSPDRTAAIERWVRSAPEIEREVEGERLRWARLKNLATPAMKVETLAALRALQRRRDDLERADVATESMGSSRDTARPRPAWVWYQMAALLLVGVGVWSSSTIRSSARGDGSTVTRSYATARGERREVVLPDSSRAILAPGTYLTYTSAAHRGDRALWLDGEVFFVVRHDARRPFVVHTSSSITRDIGTAFTVRAYPGERVSVAVESGRVAVRSADSARGAAAVILSAGELGRVTQHDVAAVNGADLSGFFSWKSGVLSYDRVPMRDILADLGREYDLDITMSDSALARRPLVLEIDGLSADHALTVISQLVGARFSRNGRHVRIQPL